MRVRVSLAISLFSALIAACTPVPVNNETPAVDADSDGFDLLVDCDDNNADIHPDADEMCDEVDNDCDGLIDEMGAVDAKTWFVDGDEDGFGDPLLTRDACTAPPFYVDNDDDCDDAAEAVFPGAVELCDNLDNNCNDEVDEGAVDAKLYFWDFDGDGFGDPDRAERACKDEAWLVTDSTDCDDGSAAVNPLAPEVCDDVDNDCDAKVDDADPTVSSDTFSQWYADGDGDGFGHPDLKLGKLSCAPGEGFTDNADDCDDSNVEIGTCGEDT